MIEDIISEFMKGKFVSVQQKVNKDEDNFIPTIFVLNKKGEVLYWNIKITDNKFLKHEKSLEEIIEHFKTMNEDERFEVVVRDDLATEEERRAECIERLKILEKVYHLHKNVLREFKSDNLVYYSESVNKVFRGILYWIRNEEKFVNIVNEFENETQSTVYHATHEYTNFGEMLDLFVVTRYKEDWEYEKQSLLNNVIYAYVVNLEDDDCSEFGGIGIRGVNGGIERVS